jgi:hypothetical protein
MSDLVVLAQEYFYRVKNKASTNNKKKMTGGPTLLKKLLFVVTAFFLCPFIISFTQSQSMSPGKNSSENVARGAAAEYKIETDNPPLPPLVQLEYLVSGPVTDLPWSSDEKFIRAKQDAGTKILMGAYRTVLKDPLPGEEYNVHLAADALAGIVVKPGEVFSQNLRIGPYTEAKGYQKGPTYIGTTLTTTIGGGVCKIASTLYNVTVLSNLQIVERNYHSMPVPYVPYGQDATVSYGNKDFRFRNNTGSNVLIWAKGIDNILYMAFYGNVEPPEVVWHHEILETYKAPRQYRIDPSLRAGEERVVLEGMDGASVKSWITLRFKDGTTKTRNMAGSYYSPLPYLIVRSGNRQ